MWWYLRTGGHNMSGERTTTVDSLLTSCGPMVDCPRSAVAPAPGRPRPAAGFAGGDCCGQAGRSRGPMGPLSRPILAPGAQNDHGKGRSGGQRGLPWPQRSPGANAVLRAPSVAPAATGFAGGDCCGQAGRSRGLMRPPSWPILAPGAQNDHGEGCSGGRRGLPWPQRSPGANAVRWGRAGRPSGLDATRRSSCVGHGQCRACGGLEEARGSRPSGRRRCSRPR